MALEDSTKEQLQKELAQLAIESVEREKALANSKQRLRYGHKPKQTGGWWCCRARWGIRCG